MASIAIPRPLPSRTGILSWLTTTDHKRIGIMYLGFNLTFFFIGGLLALSMRTQLAQPNSDILSQHTYNQIFSIHGTTMQWFFAIPIGGAFANFLLPLMLGARDMAYPRLNAFSLWLIPLAGIVLYLGYLTPGGAAAAGWTSYPPLSETTFSPGHGEDFWLLGIIILGISSVASSINFVVTAATMRAPGMTLARMPIFVWMTIVTAILTIFATPVLSGALTMLFADRNLGTHFFDAREGGNPVLWQQLFWFYAHPAVYIEVLPAMGIISEVIPVFARKPLFGRRAVIYAGAAIGVIGFTVWMHHMFATGLSIPLTVWTMLATSIIAVPTGVKMFNWLGTLWGGSISLKTPLLFSLGFLFLFLIGGIDGVYSAVVPIDYAINDTYWIVSHIHYVLFGGTVMGIFSGIFYWFPKFSGKFLSEGLGKLQFALMFIGMNLAFMPMHILGLEGMPRRIETYGSDTGWGTLNLISTVGAFTIAVGMLIFVWNVVKTLATAPKDAGDDPWEADTLEWMTASPPPEYNFESLPIIKSERPAWDARMARKTGYVPS